MSWLLKAIIFVLALLVTQAKRPPNRLESNEEALFGTELAKEKFWQSLNIRLDKYVEKEVQPVIKKWNDNLLTKADGVSPECLKVVDFMIRNPLKEEWVAKMIDASAGLPSGVLSGTTTSLGDFDQCLAIQGSFDGNSFASEYCLAMVSLPRLGRFDSAGVNRSKLSHAWLGSYFEQWHANDNHYEMARAVCFPSICKPDEIRQILKLAYEPLEYLHLNVTFCQSVTRPKMYDQRIWWALAIFLLPWPLIILGTIYDLFQDRIQCSTKTATFLRAFSLITNVGELLKVSVSTDDPSTNRLRFVHGFRSWSSILIICSHSMGFISTPYTSPVAIIARWPNDLIETSQMFVSQMPMNGALVVANFVLISGLFTLKQLALRGRLRMSFVKFLTRRWLRFAPPLVGTICISIIMELFGHGPMFHHEFVWRSVHNCYDRWHYHLLFINNFLTADKMCQIHLWYLATDMQLYVVSFLLLVVFARSRRATYFMCFALIVLGGASMIVVVNVLKLTKILNLKGVMYTQFEWPLKFLKYLSFSPFTYFIPYFTGAFLGLVLLEDRPPIKLSSKINRLIWTLTTIIILFSFFGSYLMQFEKESFYLEDQTYTHTIGFAMLWFCFALSNAWWIYQCYHTPTNYLARFLSMPIWQPFSRLSFCVYLVHLNTIWYSLLQARTPVNVANTHEMFKNFSFAVIQSILLAILLFVTFEMPSLQLTSMFLKEKPKPKVELQEREEVSKKTS